jgi:hypothetical protein
MLTGIEYKAMVASQESGKDTPVAEPIQSVTQEVVEDVKAGEPKTTQKL